MHAVPVPSSQCTTCALFSLQFLCIVLGALPVRVGHEEKIWEVRGTTPNVSNASSRSAEDQGQNMKEGGRGVKMDKRP